LMNSFSVVTGSPQQTRTWGGQLAKLLEGGEIVGLTGDLGTGKTCFVRGMAEGLEVGKEAWIRSPTFTLINEYQGRLPIYHIDLYRVGGGEEMEGLNLREYLYSDGVSVVEWFEHFPADAVEEYLELKLAHAGANKRQLTFTPHGLRYEDIIERLRNRGIKKLKGSRI
jgi:tRNA threonylcarbamoyladenosine biosynthesis protein TsaE